MPVLPMIMMRSLVLATLAASGAAAPDVTVRQLPGEQWSVRLGIDPLEHRYGAAAMSAAAGELVIAIESRPAGDSDARWSLALWSVSPSGAKLHETAVEVPGLSLRDPEVRGLVLLEGGGAVLAGGDGLRSFVVKVTPDGQSSLLWTSTGVSIAKIVAAKTGFVLAGRKGDDAYLAKIDASGKLLWERRVDRGRVEEFTDAAAAGNGVVVAGSSWSGDAFRVGPSTVWLATYDDSGAPVPDSERAFAGRYPVLARIADGGWTALYDKATTTTQQITLRSFDARSLRPSLEAPVAAVGRGLARFRVAPLPDGGSLTVGSDDFALRVARLGRGGAVAWEFQDAKRRAVDFDLVAAGDGEFYILFPALSTQLTDGSRRVNTKIGLIKLVVR